MKCVAFQGIFELQTNLEGKILTLHTCWRYSKGAPGSHNSSAHRIMYIRRVEKKYFSIWSFPPKKGPFFGGTGPMVKVAPRRQKHSPQIYVEKQGTCFCKIHSMHFLATLGVSGTICRFKASSKNMITLCPDALVAFLNEDTPLLLT